MTTEEDSATPSGNGNEGVNATWYSAAAQFYNQELSNIGQRTAAFLIVQSILLAAFVPLLTNQQQLPIAFDIVAVGITIVGSMFCIIHYQSGESGAQTAFVWREYLLDRENGHDDAPFHQFWELYRQRLFSQSTAGRPPMPVAWLVTPAIFVVVWLCALGYVISNYVLAQGNVDLEPFHQVPCWLFSILAFVAFLIIIVTVIMLFRGFRGWQRTQGRR